MWLAPWMCDFMNIIAYYEAKVCIYILESHLKTALSK
jgi:hypothetical protein